MTGEILMRGKPWEVARALWDAHVQPSKVWAQIEPSRHESEPFPIAIPKEVFLADVDRWLGEEREQ